ncbi:probable RNA-directed DNA polymerase from transposon X-element [Trichonephila clavipes]|nr:probable RNA-directed DNA polymerase from transposon X-element [Trichonephila clavipes]
MANWRGCPCFPKPPKGTALNNHLEYFLQTSSHCVVFGDFNATHSAWNCNVNSNRGKHLFNFANILNLHIAFPDSPTRFGHNSANTIDFALIKNFYYPYTIKSINDLYSDHNPVFLNFDFKLKVESSNPRAITTNWKDFRINLNSNFSLFNYYPNNINNTNDLETKITEFTEVVVATHSHASQPIVNAHRNYTPNHINQLIKHKNNLRKRYQQTLNPFYKTLCNRAQANLKKELKIYSNDTWNARLEALNTTDNSLWEAQRFLKNKRSQIPTLNCATGMAVTDPQKANLLANTIKNNFIENNRMQDNYDQDDEVVTSTVSTFLSSSPSTQIEPAMPDEIINFIKNTSSKKAPGKDTITNKMLKNFPIKLILILTILVNKILKFHHFPSNWKEAIIFPIIKPGTNKNLPNSYRPISLLSTLSKLSTLFLIDLKNSLMIIA